MAAIAIISNCLPTSVASVPLGLKEQLPPPQFLGKLRKNQTFYQCLGQTFFILWFTDIFAPYPMSGFGIKLNYGDVRPILVVKQEKAYNYPY